MKRKTTIPELIQKAGWWGGLPPVIRYDTGWVRRSDWSKPHKVTWHKIREWPKSIIVVGPKGEA